MLRLRQTEHTLSRLHVAGPGPASARHQGRASVVRPMRKIGSCALGYHHHFGETHEHARAACLPACLPLCLPSCLPDMIRATTRCLHGMRTIRMRSATGTKGTWRLGGILLNRQPKHGLIATSARKPPTYLSKTTPRTVSPTTLLCSLPGHTCHCIVSKVCHLLRFGVCVCMCIAHCWVYSLSVSLSLSRMCIYSRNSLVFLHLGTATKQ